MRYLCPMVVAFAALLCGCSSLKHDDNQGMREAAAEARHREEFHSGYARYEVARSDLPAFVRRDFQLKSRAVTMDKQLGYSLRLALGPRRRVDPKGLYRTSSHYWLTDTAGRTLASAESTLATADLPFDGSEALQLLADPARHDYLIAEQQSWATFRYILIQPGRDPRSTDWSVACVEIPRPVSCFPPDGLPHLLGVASGKIFLEVDGHIYAIPYGEVHKVVDLAYSIG